MAARAVARAVVAGARVAVAAAGVVRGPVVPGRRRVARPRAVVVAAVVARRTVHVAARADGARVGLTRTASDVDHPERDRDGRLDGHSDSSLAVAAAVGLGRGGGEGEETEQDEGEKALHGDSLGGGSVAFMPQNHEFV